MHFVQLYDSQPSSLAANVGLYVSEGLRRGDGVVVVCSREHRLSFSDYVDAPHAPGQLIWADAHETLAQVMKNGHPDWHSFERVIGGTLKQVRPAEGGAHTRVYGELVGLLWDARQYAAAVRVEQYWNLLIASGSFSLYCGYAMDVFDPSGHNQFLEKVLCTHSHLIPSESKDALQTALWKGIEDVLGDKSHEIRNFDMGKRDASWVMVPELERTMLWLTRNVPEALQSIARCAREHYERLSQSTGKSTVVSHGQ
jgi:hypothetical protein